MIQQHLTNTVTDQLILLTVAGSCELIISIYTIKNKYNIKKQPVYKSIEQAYRTLNCVTMHKVLNPFDCLITKFLRTDPDIPWNIEVIILSILI